MDYNDIVVQWDDAHCYSPAPRHRRRIMLNIIKKMDFFSCLDVGCAQPYLLELLSHTDKQLFGCDISEEVIMGNKKFFKNAQFAKIDISKEIYPENKTFDLVICSEVLEHVEDWKAAIRNLTSMANKYILITVPSGTVHKIDKLVGHIRHFHGNELIEEIKKHGYEIILCKYWGFPFHSLYKYSINLIAPEKIYENFAKRQYNFWKKTISNVLYYLFYLNDFFKFGSQLFIVVRRSEK